MKDQPEALRLSDALRESHPYPLDIRQAASELRRLAAVEAQRDALLEALRTQLSYANVLEMRLLDADGEHRAMQQARAAIKAAEGENT